MNEAGGKYVNYSCITVSNKISSLFEEPSAQMLAKVVLESYKITAKNCEWGN